MNYPPTKLEWETKLKKIIIGTKIGLSILLLLCLFEMPYGFYQLARFLAMCGFILIAHSASKKQNKIETIIYVCLAILFQPLMKISLGRDIWNIVDIIVGIGLIASIFIANKRR